KTARNDPGTIKKWLAQRSRRALAEQTAVLSFPVSVRLVSPAARSTQEFQFSIQWRRFMARPVEESNQSDLDRRSVLGLATGAAIGAVAPSVAEPAAASVSAAEIVMMDAVALRSAIHTRQVSCVEVMTAFLDHIERFNPKVNAIVALEDRSGLLKQAM